MDSYAIYIEDLPVDTTYCDIKDTFCPFQRTPPLQISKHLHYAIITFQKGGMRRVTGRKKEGGRCTYVGRNFVNAGFIVMFWPFIFICSFFLIIFLTVFAFFIPIVPPAPAPALPPAPAPYEHPFPEGFSFFYYI